MSVAGHYSCFKHPAWFWSDYSTPKFFWGINAGSGLAHMLEWVKKEIRMRSRVAGLIPNQVSCLRLHISVVLMGLSEDGNGEEIF